MPCAWAWTPTSCGGAARVQSGAGTSSAAGSAGDSSTPLLGRDVGGRQAAVDHEGRGGHVGGLVAGQEHGGLGHLARLGEAPHGHVDEPACRLLGIVGEQLLEQWRVYGPPGERGYAPPPPPRLDPPPPGK